MALEKFLEVNAFATLLFARQRQGIELLMGLFWALRCLSVPLERAIVDIVGPLDRLDHLHACLPRIHQDGPDRRGTALEDTVEHLKGVIDLAAAIALWIEEVKIENPEALQLRVDVDTGDPPMSGITLWA